MPNNKKVYIVIGVLFLAAVILVTINSRLKPASLLGPGNNSGKPVSKSVIDGEVELASDSTDATTVNYLKSQLPQGFPAGFPYEKDAPIKQNYNYYGSGIIKAERSFVTSKTLASNYSFYEKYLNANGWKITARTNLVNLKVLEASKGTLKATVVAKPNFDPSTNVVSLVFIMPAKK